MLCQVEPVKVMEPQIEADGSPKDKDNDGVQDTKALKSAVGALALTVTF